MSTETLAIIAHATALADEGFAEGRRASTKLGAVADDHRARRISFARETLGRELSVTERRLWIDTYEERLIARSA